MASVFVHLQVNLGEKKEKEMPNTITSDTRRKFSVNGTNVTNDNRHKNR